MILFTLKKIIIRGRIAVSRTNNCYFGLLILLSLFSSCQYSNQHSNEHTVRVVSRQVVPPNNSVVKPQTTSRKTNAPLLTPKNEAVVKMICIGNSFKFTLKQKPHSNQKIWVEYFVTGVSNNTSLVRRINHHAATGGYIINLGSGKACIRELLPPGALQIGVNVLEYSTRKKANYSFKVSHPVLKIESDSQPAKRRIEASCPYGAYYGNKAYIRGFLRGKDADKATLWVNGTRVIPLDGEFETLIEKKITSSDPWKVTVRALYPDGELLTMPFLLRAKSNADLVLNFTPAASPVAKLFTSLHTDSISVDGAKIIVPEGALKKATELSVTRLRETDLPPIPSEITNVTANGGGYRFLPHGSNFAIPATTALAFDSTLIPPGYGPEDVFTFYFDEKTNHWQALEKAGVNMLAQQTISVTNHFTDMINGIIKVPESPQTAGYTPTQLQGMKAADPSAAIVPIDPPQANNSGSANLSFPIKLPAGRMGMQPSLSVSYNSGGGSGWLGVGWDLQVPSITIDTKLGVPRYIADKESETYIIAGTQLSTGGNKDNFEARTSEKRFYPRTEGSFQKIIRHGNSPKNYWWEIIDKSGGHTYYGGTTESGLSHDYVLTDAKGNVGFWALTKQMDVHGNNVKYYYTKDAGVEQQIQIQKIVYTGLGSSDGVYNVTFENDSKPRIDASSDCRLGFIRINNKLLTKIAVAYNSEIIRTYALTYKPGAFNKTLLEKITENDSKGTELCSNSFNYYDDVNKNGVFSAFGKPQLAEMPNEALTGGLLVSKLGFNDIYSAISGTRSWGAGGGLSVTGGLGFIVFKKELTAGGNFDYTFNESEDRLKLMDINADGLPDKVFMRGNSMKYRPNLGMGSDGVIHFGEELDVYNAPNYISRNVTNSFSAGFEAHAVASIGYNHTWNTSKTTTYTSDFNGDGIVDFANKGSVLFGYLDNGVVRYSKSSSLTPAPINVTGVIDPSLIPDPSVELEELTDQFPLHDAVRMWRAPFTGSITIDAPVSLITPAITTPDDGRDGVKVSIQKAKDILWTSTITANDFSAKTPVLGTREVSKGERIYFRVQSLFNGLADEVEWNPIIKYSEVDGAVVSADVKDVNKQYTYQFESQKDFLPVESGSTLLPYNGNVHVSFQFEKPNLSDSIRLVIAKTDTLSNKTVFFDKTFKPDTIVDLPLSYDFAVTKGDLLEARLLSSTNVNWTSLFSEGELKYTTSPDFDVTKMASSKIRSSMSFLPNLLKLGVESKTDSVKLYKVRPLVKTNSNLSGELVFTVKGSDSLFVKQVLKIKNGVLDSIGPFPFTARDNNRLCVEYHTSNLALAASIQQALYIFKTDTIQASVYTSNNAEDVIFGHLYRGWGQFSYNGNRQHADQILNEDSMIVTTDDYASKPVENINNVDDLKNANYTNHVDDTFIPMSLHPDKDIFMGQDSAVFVSGNTISSSRRGRKDIRVETFSSEGGALPAVERLTKTTGDNESLSLIVGLSHSSSTSTSETDMMDFNGDGFPDIVKDNTIQYTNPDGAVKQIVHHGLSPYTGKADGFSASLGGISAGLVESLGKNKNSVKAAEAQKKASFSASFSASFACKDWTTESWMDMNGDGLPDKVYDNGNVCLNLGYSFANPQKWDYSEIRKGKNQTFGGGLGFATKTNSFSAGISLSKTNSSVDEQLTDVNSDGLPDRVNGNSVMLNTGNGFAPAITISELTDMDKSVSIGTSTNGAYTSGLVVFPFPPVKVVFNPRANTSAGLSRQESQMMDINGDGEADILRSNKDGELEVMLSTIGRTNLLKSVIRPMGASFELRYSQTTNSYNDPHSRRVLSGVKLYDGLKGDGADTTLTTFAYSNPYYDRAEREFFGFAKVETQQHDTQKNNALYRTMANVFDNRNYHTRQAATEEYMMDADDKLQSKTINTYQYRDALSGNVMDATTASAYNKPVFVALIQNQNDIYQGNATPQISTSQSFVYDLLGNITTFTDYADGEEAEKVEAKITYHNNDAKYIKGIPQSIEVYTSAGLARKRNTAIDEFGNTTEINLFNSNGKPITYNMTYDTYGNISNMTRPVNHKGERMFYAYTYDDVIHALVTKVTDAYGYTSTAEYNYVLQVPTLTLDRNKQPIRYSYDDAGRMSTVTGPFEIAAGKPYTLAFDYNPMATVPYARTRHYDPQNGGDMEIYTFMDGLLRPVQVKKTALRFEGKDKTDASGFTVSGKQAFDALGRPVAAWYSTFEPTGNATNYNTDYDDTKPTMSTYDVNDRPLTSTLPDNAKTTMSYSFTMLDGHNMAVTTLIDALGHSTTTLTDAKGRQRKAMQKNDATDVITSFAYNPLGELLEVTNPLGQKTTSVYDMLGRRASVSQPDNGLTSFTYDPAGNVIEKITANIRKSMPGSGAIKYSYDFERISQIDYPKNIQNKVQYSYGAPGELYNRAGQVTLIQDASGGQEFYYSALGQVTKTIRTLLLGSADMRTYITQNTYDTWNRITDMTYPDGEKVTYQYDAAGNMQTMDGLKDGRKYSYVKRIGYDTDNRQTYLQYGNRAETSWNYDKERKRLSGLTVASNGTALMDNTYKYDAIDNVLGITNNAALPTTGLGCNGSHSYKYDQLNRLITASGSYNGTNSNTASYTLAMQYDAIGNILLKDQQHTANGKTAEATSHKLEYTYNNSINPNAASKIGDKTYTYDANGNPTQWEDDDNNYRQMLWDEENRLMMINDNGMVSNYTYDHAGERAVKSYGGTQGVYINGAPAGSVDHSLNAYTVYVSPYMVVSKERFTKHYYAGSTRICSKIGAGEFNNQYRPGVFGLSAGSVNYMERAYLSDQSRKAYYTQLGIPPGPPTAKGINGEPEKTGNPLPVNTNVSPTLPAGWPTQPKFAEPGNPPGPPIQWGASITNPTAPAGFGYVGTGAVEELDWFFYHTDHLGSSSIITNARGNVGECMAYMPFGETLISQKNTSFAVPYLFTSKELDAETGLYYFGARYYDPNEGRWWGVDPLAEKYPEVSSYVYCHNNPVNMIDPDGRWDVSVHASTDRGKHPYAVYVVTDRTGNVIYKTVVRATGAGGRTRNATNADTPQGRYKILEWRKTGNAHYPTRSYGPNDLLALEYQGGEGGKRQGMHTHGKGTEKPNELGVTNGCMRMLNDDIKELKQITTELEQNDPKETKGFLTVKDDLIKPVSYTDRDTYKKEEKTYNGGVLKEVVVIAKREKQ